MGNMLTYNGAAIYHKVQRIAVECGSSLEAEALASFKLLDVLLTARNVLTQFGTPPQGPTFVATGTTRLICSSRTTQVHQFVLGIF